MKLVKPRNGGPPVYRALFNYYGRLIVETSETPLDAKEKLEERLEKMGIDYRRYIG